MCTKPGNTKEACAPFWPAIIRLEFSVTIHTDGASMSVMRGFWTVRCAAFAVAIVGAFYSTQTTFASVISGSMQEPFADQLYTNGYTFVNTPVSPIQNSGQGWNVNGTTDVNNSGSPWGTVTALNSGTARTATSPGLTSTAIGYLNGTGNKLTLDATISGTTGQNIGRTLGGQSIDSGITYFSLLMSRNSVDNFRTQNIAFFNDTNERFAVGQIGAAAGTSGGNITLLMNNSNPAGLIVPANPIAMGNGITHLIVGRIDWNAAGNETVAIWVDPANVTTEAAAGAVYASTNGFELTNLTRVRPFVGANVTGPPVFSAVSGNYDEIRLGGTWESVTSQPVPVPEPATLVIAAIGVVGLITGRRRACR
jgi:hypothetical protein